MFRKVLSLVLICLLLTSFSSVVAQMTFKECKSQMRDLVGELKDARKACNTQIDDLRKAALEKVKSMGRGTENRDDKKAVMYECLKAQAAVRADYNKQRDLIQEDMENLRISYREVKAEKRAAFKEKWAAKRAAFVEETEVKRAENKAKRAAFKEKWAAKRAAVLAR